MTARVVEGQDDIYEESIRLCYSPFMPERLYQASFFEAFESPDPHRHLREALAPYVDLIALRELAQKGKDLKDALRTGDPPQEVSDIIDTLAALLLPSILEKIRHPSQLAAPMMVKLGHLDHEELWVANLDTKGQLHHLEQKYVGCVDSTTVRVGELYRYGVAHNMSTIIVVHNHPTGNTLPSPEDLILNTRIKEAGELLDISLGDHIIVGQGYYSMYEHKVGGFGKR